MAFKSHRKNILVSLRADVSPGNCCKIARIDRISSLFNDDGDSRLWM
ncbi:hypothetical protein [Candidatus Tisiphia endosymbiont of Sialis lutaria]